MKSYLLCLCCLDGMAAAAAAAANRAYACTVHVYRGHVKTKEIYSSKGKKNAKSTKTDEIC